MDSSDRGIPQDTNGDERQAGTVEPFFLEVGDAADPAAPPAQLSPAEAQPAGDAVPEWFARKQVRQPAPDKPAGEKSAPDKPAERSRPVKKKAKPPTPPLVVVETKDEGQELTWQEQLKQWAVGGEGKGVVVSALLHLVLLLTLSFILLRGMRDNEVSTLVTVADAEVSKFDDIADTAIEMPQVEQPNIKALVDAATVAQPAVALSTSISQSLAGDGGEGKFAFAMPKSAVTKGSFSAWTVPEDPAPSQNYLIIIQIKLPAKLKLPKYPLKDLTGKVVGTDGYEQEIPDEKLRENGYLPIHGGVTQLTVTVPGAAKLVKDRIEVKSINLLKEQQILEIEF